MKILRLIISPLFWIVVTYAGITYGPEIVRSVKSGKPLINQVKKSNGETLGSNNITQPAIKKLELPSPPQSMKEIPEYAKEIANVAAQQAMQTGQTAVSETTSKVTENVCLQIISELQKQCAPSPTATPTPGGG